MTTSAPFADILAPQLDHFAPADTAPRRDQHQCLEPFGDGVGQLGDLGHVEDDWIA